MKSIDTAQVLVDHLPSLLISSDVKPYIYKAYQALEEGHLCIDLEGDVEHFPTNNSLYHVARFGDVSKFYLRKYWSIENQIYSKLQELIYFGKSKLLERNLFLEQHKTFIANELFSTYYPDKSDIQIDWQKVASLNAFLYNFAIITGGPGTGKTTTVAKLIYLLFLESTGRNLNVELVAQTGKAAARLKESLMISAGDLEFGIGQLNPEILNRFSQIHPKTIHRLLGYNPNNQGFEYNADNLLPADVVIVDEASMADAPLLASLLQALKKETRLYLLGDRNQLTSVEVGSVFSDLCLAKLDAVSDLSMVTESAIFQPFLSEQEKRHFVDYHKPLPSAEFIDQIIELKRSFRFNDRQQIGLLAKNLIADKTLAEEDLKPYMGENGKEVRFLENNSNPNFFFENFRSYLNETNIPKALQLVNKAKVLCALKRDALEYNALTEKFLHKNNLLEPNEGYYHNQPIMITANDYFSGLYNGDIGLIREDENGNLRAYFEFSTSDGKGKEIKNFSPAGILSFETAFAITIHKSQGSEFDSILMVLPTNDDKGILTKELVYTGLTRAKKCALIMCDKDIFLAASNQPVSRISGLANRISHERGAI
jgi:exodeoxyribonuclease V alpha subunit